MGDKIKLIIDNYIHEQSWKKKIVITLMISSLFVVTGVFWTLKLKGIAMAGDAFCGKEEHIHNDECYESVLICELEESEEHQHKEECYEKHFICNKEEHTHVKLCYSDINADKEDETTWKSTLPSLSKDWSKDLVNVALSQKGYKESEKNFVLSDTQTRKGYTRYGAWYGNEYGDWNEMFASFCLNYADIPNEAVPYSAGFQAWKVALEEKEIYEYKESYVPQVGDIVFFKNESVGIVTQVTDQLYIIMGDLDDEVKEINYDITDENIDGYANIQKAKSLYLQRNVISLKADIYTNQAYQQLSNDQTIITVTGELPKNAMVKAYPVITTIDNCEVIASYDISIFLEDGTLYEPQNQILTVQFTLPEIKENEQLSVYHVSESSLPEVIKANVTDNDIIFETTHFSVYAVVRAVEPRDGNTILVANANEFVNAFNSGNDDIVQLTADITISNSIQLNKKMTLDLNGHKLTARNTLFTIQAGGELSIRDSVENDEVISKADDKELYGNLATYDKNSLTYYVTKTEVKDNRIGTTQETLEQHIVSMDNKGQIEAGGQPLVTIQGGIVHLESGMLYGGTNRAFKMSGGILNLKGGYIFGFKKTGAINTGKDNFGGAVLATNGEINISGSVIAGNEALNGGAIFTEGSTKINITDGIVSGNTSIRTSNYWNDHSEGAPYRCGGGGIYASADSLITMIGGYITNNTASDTGYFDGGGGVFLTGNSRMILNNGYITGNKAQGGGGIRTDFGKKTSFEMNYGFISTNIATTAEGGGVTIDRAGVGSFNKGYITNNRILKTDHWGGGGLFCADGSDLFLKKALITENDAGGFGGGVAGCPTGKIYLYIDDGCAIYNNDDIVDGEIHFVNGGAKDDIDTERCDKFFQSHGHKDYFCALNSTVTGTMLGNYAANWEGSADGTAVSLGANDAQTATSVMGLESHPSSEGINAAQEKAEVYINGNYSYTHGGGILCNGNLIIGNPTDIEIPARLGLNATKVFLDGSGDKISDLDKYDFQFEILDGNNEVVSTGTCDKSGKITFENLEFNAAGTYTYTIKEKIDDSNPNINYDTTTYRLTVTVKEEKTQLYERTKTAYLITNTKVEKYNKDGGWTNISNNSYDKGKDNLSLELTNLTTFTNTTLDVSKITVIKKWADNHAGADKVTVELYQDDVLYDTVELSQANDWKHTWIDLPLGYTYHVKEQEVRGYIASYSTSNPQGENKEYWVPATSLNVGKKYMIVNNDGNQALYISLAHEKHAFDSSDRKSITQITGTLTLGKNTYSSWYNPKSIDSRCVFTAESRRTENGNTGIILKNDGTTQNTWLLIQARDGNILKSASQNFYASFMDLQGGFLKGQYEYNWNPEDMYTVVYEDNKFNTSKNSNNAVQLYTLVSGSESDGTIITITNTPKEEYELPETGGNGTHLFVLVGLLLMLTPIIYKFKSRSKESKIKI